LATIRTSLAGALADGKTREASLITFLAAAANITVFGICGAFWVLLIGLLAYAVLSMAACRRGGSNTAPPPPVPGKPADARQAQAPNL